MTITYRLIGKGTTDENGIAHMDYSTSDGGSTWTDISSNPGYTGVGAGEIDLLASTDNPITSSSCQSEPYTLYDTIFHLECTTETANWSYNDARVSASFDENGGHFTGLESTSFKQVTLTNNGARFLDGTKDHVIEYDIKKSSAVRLALIDNGANTRQLVYFGASYSNDWNHIKIVYDADNHTATVYVGDTALTPVDLSSYTMTTFGITFLDNSSNQMDFYVKNIKIYYG